MEILFKAAYQKSETLSVISPLLQVTHHFLSSATLICRNVPIVQNNLRIEMY